MKLKGVQNIFNKKKQQTKKLILEFKTSVSAGKSDQVTFSQAGKRGWLT